jgi:hypothetical protein
MADHAGGRTAFSHDAKRRRSGIAVNRVRRQVKFRSDALSAGPEAGTVSGMSWIAAVLLSSVLAGEPQAVPTPSAPALSCENTGYARDRLLVATEETAKAIFLAVEREIFPGADRTGFPLVEAMEAPGEPGFWLVMRVRTPEPGLSYRGGGQLGLRIAKCDGAISDVALSR